jgi:hypothetical protein
MRAHKAVRGQLAISPLCQQGQIPKGEGGKILWALGELEPRGAVLLNYAHHSARTARSLVRGGKILNRGGEGTALALARSKG